VNIQIAKIPVPVDTDSPSFHTLLHAITAMESVNERLRAALFHCGQDIAEIERLTISGKPLTAKKTAEIFKLVLAAQKHTK